MLVCAVDFESTGLDTANDRIIEIGAVIWDTRRKAPLKLMSTLVKAGVPLSDDIVRITGITQEDLDRFGKEPLQALSELILDFLQPPGVAVDTIIAHNGNGFDKPLFEAECLRHGLLFPKQHWIDTSIDVEYPESIKTRKLTHLAAEHGFINPLAHRAVTDVLTMLKVLAHYDIEKVMKLSLEPQVKLIADTKKPWLDLAPEGKKETDKARARGFRWDGGRKTWVKLVRQSQVDAELAHGEFGVRIAAEG